MAQPSLGNRFLIAVPTPGRNVGSIPAVFNPDESVTLQKVGSNNAYIQQLPFARPSANDTSVTVVLHGLSWSIPSIPSGHQGRLRNFFRTYANSSYLNSAWYLYPGTFDDCDAALSLRMTDGGFIWWLSAGDSIGDANVTIQRWSVIFGSDLSTSSESGGIRVGRIVAGGV